VVPVVVFDDEVRHEFLVLGRVPSLCWALCGAIR
jgi:hypothetical protein